MDSVGEGEGGMIWENSIVTMYLIIYEIDRQSRFDAWDGAQGWCTGMTLRDGMGREVRGAVQDGEHVYTHGWFMSMYGKNHYNIVK